ncbi:hypothetical protein O0L34_g14038 [Tuta absoluta]|nr:hypothetical protein O0L34_g14038 [Tuta absoluta]
MDDIVEIMEDLTPSLDQDSDLEQDSSETRLNVHEKNGHDKMLRRLDTVPDIKRDTTGITTQYIATGIVNLGALAAGVCVAWSSSALPLLTPGHHEFADYSYEQNASDYRYNRLQMTQSEASWVACLLCLGALFGAVPAGLISQFFGRKKTLVYLALPLVVSWIMVASSPNVYGLYVGRVVGGVAVGAFSVSIPPYIEDIAEKPLLSTLANFYHLHFSCGILFGYIIGMVNSIFWHCLLCSSIPVAFFIAFIFLPESPAYLISQGKFAEAKTSLRYFRGIDNDIDAEMKEIKENIRYNLNNKVTFKQLFSRRITVKALVVSFGLMIFQQLSGIYPILFYADSVFKPFDMSLNPPGGAIILGFCFVSSTYFSSVLLKNIRRRVLLLVSLTSMAVCLGSLATYYHLKASNVTASSTWVPLLTLCVYVITYAVGIGPIPWLMLREIFPANVTRRATAITAGFHWFLAFGVTKFYQNLIEKVSPGWTLWHFAVTCLVGTIFVYFFVPETKGRTLEEIQDEFDGIHKTKRHRHVIEVID